MSGIVLQLCGPMQSWGSSSPWNRRETERHPTRSGLLGMVAAVIGLGRDDPIIELATLRFTIRIDRPGQLITDFHTVGGGRPREQTPVLARLKFRKEGKGTLVSERYYLSDAVFTVAVTSDGGDILDRIGDKLARPAYAPFLGRRSCPPAGAFMLGRHEDPARALFDTIPVARTAPRQADTVAVDYVTETPPTDGVTSTQEVRATQPLNTFRSRAFASHTTWRSTHHLPAQMCGGVGLDYLQRLASIGHDETGGEQGTAAEREENR
ncbi:type I-E CRISPR-associated protein Cas5/CasD [Saccharothrix sp. NPDC042600]|uniref:type I-E CRISPR-associated protein Cas5/CasD n=1 Tax=Saccharothrix TaxID=2071 RepID=UPI0033E2C416